MEHTRKLADPDDLIPRQVGDRCLADDWRHVVLAVRLEGNVLQENYLIVPADFLEGAAEMNRRILFVSAGIFAPGSRDATRCIEKPYAVGIVAGPTDQRPDGFCDFARNFAFRRGLDEVAILRIAMIVHSQSSHWISSATAAACSRISGTA